MSSRTDPPPNPTWAFRARFRTNAYSWKASKLACDRLKEALAEIKAVAAHHPLAAAEGAILLMERIWPALQHVDSSSGALGTAVGKTVHGLIDIILAAPVDAVRRERWLERLWRAVEEDRVDYLWEVTDRWGELCGTPERASRAADELLPGVRISWEGPGGYFRGQPACLGCLLVAGRHEELLALIDTASYLSWDIRRFGVRALAAMGRTDEAIAYARASQGLNDSPAVIAQTCEALLLQVGRADEAYAGFALTANQGGTHLATCRAIIKKYPHQPPSTILADLIASTPGEEGRWFATAKTLGFLDLAAELAERSPVDIGTLLRAARDHVQTHPGFALAAAQAALRWMAAGRFYEITAQEVQDARGFALRAAEAVGRTGETQGLLADLAACTETHAFVRDLLGGLDRPPRPGLR